MLCGGDGKHMGQCTRLYWTGCFRNINGIKCIHLPGFSLDCFWGWIEGHLEFEYMSCGTWIVLDPTIKPWILNTWNVDHSKSGSRVETVFSDQLISGWFWFLLFFQMWIIINPIWFETWIFSNLFCFETWNMFIVLTPGSLPIRIWKWNLDHVEPGVGYSKFVLWLHVLKNHIFAWIEFHWHLHGFFYTIESGNRHLVFKM